MVLRRARTVDEIHAEVADHDLVITPEPSLFLALNRRASRARVGHLAATPKVWADSELDWPDRRRLFQRIVQELDIPWKRAAWLLEHAVSAWEETGTPRTILDHPGYRSEAAEDVLHILETTESSYRQRATRRIPDDLDVAVVAPEHLTALDRQVLPDDRTSVPLFVDETHELAPLHIHPSRHAIVRTVVEHARQHDPRDIGVVLAKSSPYRALLEAGLQAEGIPVQRDVGIAEDEDLRAFLHAARLAPERSHVRGRDVRSLRSHVGSSPWIRDDHRRVDAADAAEDLRAFWDELETATFGDALDAFERLRGAPIPTARGVVQDLGIEDEPVTDAGLDGLDLYLDAFDPPAERHGDGVLLSGLDSGTVDRPLVFTLGLDADWTFHVPDHPWVDVHRHRRIHRDRLERILQGGARTVPLVLAEEGGRTVAPSPHLHDIVDADLATFRDLPHREHAPHPAPDPEPFQRVSVPVDPDPPTTVSASSLDVLLTNPRAWQARKLVTTPTLDVMRRGSLVHDLAQVMSERPDLLEDLDIDDLLDHVLTELAPLVDADHLPLVATRLRIALDNIRTFLDAYPPKDVDVQGYAEGGYGNDLAELLDIELPGDHAERWFEDEALGVKGKVDLILTPTTLVDWKTGSTKPSTRKLMDRCFPDRDPDRITTQPAVYLAHHRTRVPDEDLEFHLVPLLANAGDVLHDRGDVEDIVATARYHAQGFGTWAASEDGWRAAIGDVKDTNDRRRTLEALGPTGWHRVVAAHEVPTDPDEAPESALADALHRACVDAQGDYKYVRKAAERAVKRVAKARGKRFYAEDLDAFLDIVRTTLQDLATWHREGFPPTPVDPDRVDRPDLVLAGEGWSP